MIRTIMTTLGRLETVFLGFNHQYSPQTAGLVLRAVKGEVVQAQPL